MRNGKQNYRKIRTKRGVYFVPWLADHVAAFLADEGIEPEDIRPLPRSDRCTLCRELFLLSCSECMAHQGRENSAARLLASFARRLQSLRSAPLDLRQLNENENHYHLTAITN